jgi:hypothetical protein
MRRIPIDEVQFHPHSFGDPSGRVFAWNGGIYRGITRTAAAFVRGRFEDGVFRRLMQRGLLIDSELSDLELDGYELVVRHRAVPICSYPHEWCVEAFRDAALGILDLVDELARDRLTLKDGHPWNVLADDGGPVWVDLTSVASAENGWLGYDEFAKFCLRPFLLMCHGHDRIARALLPTREGVTREEVELLVGAGVLSKLRAGGARLGRKAGTLLGRSEAPLVELLRHEIEETPLPSPEPPLGTTSRAPEGAAAHGRAQLRRVLDELRPKAVLDLTTAGVECVAGPGMPRLIALDSDHARIGALYRRGRSERLPLLPLVVDFQVPTPAMGVMDHWLIGAVDRLRSDLVLGLGLLPDAVTRRRLNVAQVAEALAGFSRRWAVVELPGAGPEHPESYRPERFIEALGERFPRVTRIEGGAGAELLVCER